MPPDGLSVASHFGEWLQGRIGVDGPVALVTLRCPALTVRVAAEGERADAPLFTPDQLEGFAASLGIAPVWPGLVRDMVAGGGAGASTATLVALARAGGFEGSPEALAAACLAVEGACDPLMYPAPDRLLWASREARVLRRLPAPPACEIVGGFWGRPERTDPSDQSFPDVSDLVEDWARAVDEGSLQRCAQIASVSASRCTETRGPADPMADLAADLGAVGHVRAHTGSARGLVFAEDTVPSQALDTLREAGLASVLQFRTGQT